MYAIASSTAVTLGLPICGSMRLKMANAEEGCWYNLLNVVPGWFSRKSESCIVPVAAMVSWLRAAVPRRSYPIIRQ